MLLVLSRPRGSGALLGLTEVGYNVRWALWVIGENAGHIKQGLARLVGKDGD